MRHYLLFLALLFSTLFYHLFGQQFAEGVLQPHMISHGVKMVPAHDGNYFIVSQVTSTNGYFWGLHLTKIGRTGNVLWERTIQENRYLSVNFLEAILNVFVGNDSSIIIGARHSSCDHSFYHQLVGFNKEGDFVWTKSGSIGSEWNFAYAMKSDGRIVVINKDSILTYDLEGNLENGVPVNIRDGILIAHAIAGEESLLVGHDKKIMKIDEAGQVLKSRSAPSALLKFVESRNRIFAIFEKKVLKLSTDLQVLDSLMLPVKALDLFVQDSIVWLLAGNGVTQLDDELNELSNFNFNSQYRTPKSIFVDEKIWIIGTESPRGNKDVSHNIFWKAFSKNGETTDYGNDAIIAGMENPHNLRLERDTMYRGVYYVKFDSLNFQIRNDGDSVLTKVIVNLTHTGNNYTDRCIKKGTQRQYIDLVILPGETQLFEWGAFTASLPVPVTTFDFCLWTSVPNGHLDIDHTNDGLCRRFPVVLATDELKSDTNVRISPNPANNFININLPQNHHNDWYAVIYNSLGMRLLEKKVTDFEDTGMDVTPLRAGAYFLILENENGARIGQRFLKI